MKKYINKYRIPFARNPAWDYGGCGNYFVTICTKNRRHFFGEVVNEIMVKNQLGAVAEECWQSIPAHFPFVRLGEYVVMQDHVHGILFVETQYLASLRQIFRFEISPHAPPLLLPRPLLLPLHRPTLPTSPPPCRGLRRRARLCVPGPGRQGPGRHPPTGINGRWAAGRLYAHRGQRGILPRLCKHWSGDYGSLCPRARTGPPPDGRINSGTAYALWPPADKNWGAGAFAGLLQ